MRIRQTELRAMLGLTAIAAIWGLLFVVTKMMGTQTALSFLVIRFFVGGIVLLPFCSKGRRFIRREVKWGTVGGLFLGMGYVCMILALRISDAGQVGMLVGLNVIFVPILLFIAGRRLLSFQSFAGVIVACIGLFFVSQVGQQGVNGTGTILALGAALGFAGQLVVLSQQPPEFSALRLTVWQMFSAGVLCAIVFLALGQLWPSCANVCAISFDQGTLLSGLISGVFGGALAVRVLTWAGRLLSGTASALLVSLQSPFAVLFGGILLHESLTGVMLLGCVLMCAGAVIVVKERDLDRDISSAVVFIENEAV